MKLGFVGQFPEAARVAQEIGATGLPLWIHVLSQQGPNTAVTPVRDAGMAVCQVGAFGFNPLAPDRNAQAQQTEMVRRAIPTLARVGCPHVVVNSGNHDESGFMRGHPDNFTDAALDTAAAALEPVLALAEEHGARIVIEPMVHCVVSSPARFLALKQRVQSEALRINLDICNMLTLADVYASTGAVKRICEELAGQYDLVHCKDLTVARNVHIHIDETPLGTGLVDWASAMPLVARDLPEDGWFIYEHVKSADDARAGIEYLRGIAAEGGVHIGGQ